MTHNQHLFNTRQGIRRAIKVTADDGARRPTFSQRHGLRPHTVVTQIESLDDRTRMDLWNLFMIPFVIESRTPPTELEVIWAIHLGLDSHQFGERSFYDRMRKLVLQGEWYEIMDLIEFVVEQNPDYSREQLAARINRVFALNRVGYRVIDTQIVPITSPEEVAAVEEAAQSPLENSRTHIKRALELHSVRENPNYSKVIHEAMSAAESAAQALAAKPGATLGDALNEVLKKSNGTMHPALIEGWKRIYGFTSDSGGIRHALRDGTVDPDQATAQYFLITCSAFVNLVAGITAG